MSRELYKSYSPGEACLTEKQFARLAEFIHSTCGIKLSIEKKRMLEARLAKRLRALGLSSFPDYCDFLFSAQGQEEELVHMIDMVTTNKTEFFRENAHFDYLSRHALPELERLLGAGTRRPLMIWSAGCSTGEEPYTLSMILSEMSSRYARYQFGVLATDISTRVLDIARRAVYEEEKIRPVPEALKRKYLMKGTGEHSGYYRVVPELRERVRFRRLNFMEGDFGMREPMDVIFCRNVIIYFDRPTQERLLQRFCSHLVTGGYVFMGHSETLHGLNLPLETAAPTVYRKVR